MSIDRKIRVHLEPKTAIAFSILRRRFDQHFTSRMKNPSLVGSADNAVWMDLMKEALVTKRLEETEVKKESRVKVQLSLHRNAA